MWCWTVPFISVYFKICSKAVGDLLLQVRVGRQIRNDPFYKFQHRKQHKAPVIISNVYCKAICIFAHRRENVFAWAFVYSKCVRAKLKQYLVPVLFTYWKANHLLEEISVSLLTSIQPWQFTSPEDLYQILCTCPHTQICMHPLV